MEDGSVLCGPGLTGLIAMLFQASLIIGGPDSVSLVYSTLLICSGHLALLTGLLMSRLCVLDGNFSSLYINFRNA